MDNSQSGQDNLGPTVLVIAWVFIVIATIVVGTRYYVRLRIVRKFTIDDGIILWTWVSDL
jgi:uncharacterized protein YybS (DUF2232 family)